MRPGHAVAIEELLQQQVCQKECHAELFVCSGPVRSKCSVTV